MTALLTFLAGFFRDPASAGGKPSMTRLSMAFLVVESFELVQVVCYVALHTDPGRVTLIGALAAVLVTIVTNGIVLVRNRRVTGESAS